MCMHIYIVSFLLPFRSEINIRLRSEVETLEKNPGTAREAPPPLNSHLFPRTYDRCTGANRIREINYPHLHKPP